MSYFTVTPEHIAEFHRRGFLTVRQLFDRVEMDHLRECAKNDQALADESYARRDLAGDETRLTLWNELHDDSVYAAIVRSQRVAASMSALLGDEVYHYHHKMILKERLEGGAWEWHQDYGYWYNFGCLFPDMGSCTLAIDRADQRNGCLQLIPGSHCLGRIDHLNTGEQVGADPDRVEAALKRLELVHCELEPGDAVFFHANLLHRSDRNSSDQPRWSLICCYNTRHNDPFISGGRHPNYSPLDIWPDERVRKRIIGSQ